MTTGRYFLAAAAMLLLGASAMPIGLAGYALASSSREPYATAVGVWSTFVIVVAIVSPIILLVGGFISLLRTPDASP